MDCKECESLIDDYIYNRLDEQHYENFSVHVSSCEKCKEELVINYSLLTALEQLDSGSELDGNYEDEINRRLNSFFNAKKRSLYRFIFSCFAIFLLSLFLTTFLMLFSDRDEPVYSKNRGDVVLDFNYNGLPSGFDPVQNSIDDYNVGIIDYLHSKQSESIQSE